MIGVSTFHYMPFIAYQQKFVVNVSSFDIRELLLISIKWQFAKKPEYQSAITKNHYSH